MRCTNPTLHFTASDYVSENYLAQALPQLSLCPLMRWRISSAVLIALFMYKNIGEFLQRATIIQERCSISVSNGYQTSLLPQ